MDLRSSAHSLYIAVPFHHRSRSIDLYIGLALGFSSSAPVPLGSLSIPFSLLLLSRYASLICLQTYFNKAQVGIISQSVAQLLLHKLGGERVFFDKYRR